MEMNHRDIKNKNSNSIILSDSLVVLKSIENNTIDLVITSPPYANQRKKTYGGVSESEYLEWFKEYAIEIKRVLKDTGSFFLNIKPHCKNGERSLYVFDLVLMIQRDLGFRFTDEFCWTKNAVPGKFIGRFKNAFEPVYHFTLKKGFTHNPYACAKEAKETSLKRYKRKACGETKNGSGFAGMRKEILSKKSLPSNHLHFVQKNNQYTLKSKHSAVFPEELSYFFIKSFSNVGDLVLDPFAGSGTVGVSCKKLERRYILVDNKVENYNLMKKILNE